MVSIQKYVILLVFGAFSVNYAMNIEDGVPVILPEAFEGWQTPSSSDTSSNPADSDPYCYTHEVTNPDTGSTLTVEVATDGHDWGVGLSYNRVEQDNYEKPSSSVLEPEGLPTTESRGACDSYTDSIVDSSMQDGAYWQQQREAKGDGSKKSTQSLNKNRLPDRTYVLDAIVAKLRSAEQIFGYHKRLKDEILRIEEEMAHAWHGNAVRAKQVQFLRMMRYGNLPSRLSTIQHGDKDAAQKEFDRLVNLWPWQYKTSFLVRNPSNDEQAFITFIGSDVLKEAERCLASRAAEFYPSLLQFHRGCIEQQMRGDLEGLKEMRTRIHEQLNQGREKQWIRLSYQSVIVDTMIADPVTHMLYNIAHNPLPIARAELLNLHQQVCQFYREYNVTSMSQASTTMIEQHGFDLLAAGQKCFQARLDYDPQVEFASSEAYTMIFRIITDGPLQEATSELYYFEKQLDDHFTQYKVKPEDQTAYMIANLGYDVRAVARALYKARSDYDTVLQDNTAQSNALSQKDEAYHSLPIPQEMKSVRASMLESLNQSTHQVQLADNCAALARDVFGQARYHNYEVHPEVYDRVHGSIGIIRVTPYAHEIIFHVAVVDRVLGDIQYNVAVQNIGQPTLLDRTPGLLVHGLQKFVAGLNPVTQAQGLCEFVVNTAHFACDVTVGKMYLSPEDYRARIDGFWDTIDALSPENLAQLSAENWVELGANLAAGLVLGAGVYKTVTYLKEIEATSRVARQAAKIAGKLKAAIDTTLRQHPILITAEGVLIRNYDKIEEVTQKVVSVVKDSQTLIEVAAEKTLLLQNATQQMGNGVQEEIKLILDECSSLVKSLIDGTGKLIKGLRTENTMSYYIEHAFSEDHIKNGLLTAGTKSEIVTNALKTICRFDRLGELRMGGNQIRIVMNSVDITIRVHIKDSLLYSFDVMPGHTPRIIGHLIDAVGK